MSPKAPPTEGPADDPRRGRSRVRRRQWGGWIAVGALVILLLLSVASGGVFLLAALVLAGLFLFALGVTGTSVLGLAFERHLSESEGPVGATVEGRLVLHNRKPWPALWLLWSDRVETGLDVEGPSMAFDNLTSKGSSELRYRLHTTRRGLYRLGPAVAEAADPFGLVRRFHLASEAAFLTVLPRTLAIGQGWPLGHRPIHQVPRRGSLFEDPTRFLGVRDYRPGDSPRRIHWRASARSAGLQVKVFEPAVLDGALLALDAGAAAYPVAHRGTGGGTQLGDPRFELAVTAAASLAEAVLAGNQEVALISNGTDAAERYPDDWQGGTFRRIGEVLDQTSVRRKLVVQRPVEVPAAKGGEQRHRLALALARLELAEGASLAELLHTELPRLARSLVMLVITPRLDAALVAVLGELRRSGFDLGVVWIGGGDAPPPGGLPAGLPVWPVLGDADLERLGSLRL